MLKDQFGNELTVGDVVNVSGSICQIKEIDYLQDGCSTVLVQPRNSSSERRLSWRTHNLSIKGWIQMQEGEVE